MLSWLWCVLFIVNAKKHKTNTCLKLLCNYYELLNVRNAILCSCFATKSPALTLFHYVQDLAASVDMWTVAVYKCYDLDSSW